MYLLNYSLNNLTMMALTIATGFVVDDAIVMLENINRFLEEGMEPMEAALTGAKQIGFTIVSLTVSLIAVLIPLLLMGDITGRLFREFAVTLAVTIIISSVVSLTLTPMMAARLLHYVPASEQGSFHRWSDSMFHRLIALYGRTLQVVLRHRTAVLMVAVGTLVLTIVLYIKIPKGFFPVQDTGVIQAVSQAPESTSFDAMQERQQALGRANLVVHRHRWHEHDDEQRPHADQPEAAGAAQNQRHGRDQPVAAETGCDLRHPHVSVAGAGSLGGKPRDPHAVSVHGRRSRSGGRRYVDREAGGQAQKASGTGRCDHRRTAARPGGRRASGSRYRIKTGYYAVDDR
jgi:hypothetical protein